MTTQEQTVEVGGVASERLKSIVDRVVRLEEEKKGIGQDISDIYAEAKGVGFDAKIVRRIVKEVQANLEKLREEEELIALYRHAVGLEV